MRFSCESCNAKYQISDDKVGPAGVKVRCKKCGHLTLVRRDQAEEAAPSATAPGVEWWVAIDEQPVGPVGLEVVQHHWDQGEIGPESLVWFAGLAEWTPIGSVPELHGVLTGGHPPAHAPIPRGQEGAAHAAAAAPAPAPEEEWRPSAASALAALEEPEFKAAVAAAAQAPDEAPDEAPRATTPSPDTGPVGVDPSGMRPLPMAGLERTGERRVATTPGPRGATLSGKLSGPPRKEGRTLNVVLVIALVVVAVAAAGLWWMTK